MLARIITKLVAWAVAIFYDVERTGPVLPDGPVLVTANHPNALVDPLVVFRTGGRMSRPLAKAPLFEQPLVGTVLRGLGGLPVYRREDDPDRMHLNDRTFEAAIAALHGGEAVQIFPEGKSHSEPSMAPLRTGAARIALQAEAQRGWTLGLRVQPVGLTYTRKHLFRGRVVAAYGDSFAVGSLRELYERDEREAVRALTEEMRTRLETVTLNFDDAEDRLLVEVAERLYARERRLDPPDAGDGMAHRLPRLRRFAEGLRWLRSTDPERHERLVHGVRRYLRLSTLFGASAGRVPRRYRPAAVARYVALQLVYLALVFPLALVGILLWAPPYLGTRRVWPIFRPKLDQVATYKLGTAVLAFPLWLAALVGGATLAMGWRWGLGVGLGAPLFGFAAVAWREREERVREDARVFVRALRNPRGRERLAEHRSRLAEEFDALASIMEEGG